MGIFDLKDPTYRVRRLTHGYRTGRQSPSVTGMTNTLSPADRAELLRDEVALSLTAVGYPTLCEATFSDVVEEVAAELEAHEARKAGAA